jgi:hypothetical protein
MASLEVMYMQCSEPKCDGRATRVLKDERGNPVGQFCARHANPALIKLAKEEGKVKS